VMCARRVMCVMMQGVTDGVQQ